MKIQVRHSDGSQEPMTIPADIQLLMLIVGGEPKAIPYDDGRVLVYSEGANRRRPNIKFKGKQYFGTIALMKEEDYGNLTRG